MNPPISTRISFPKVSPLGLTLDSDGFSGIKIHNRIYTPLNPPLKKKMIRIIVEFIPKNLPNPPQTPAIHLSERERYNLLILLAFHINYQMSIKWKRKVRFEPNQD